MTASRYSLLIAAMLLAGCDQITEKVTGKPSPVEMDAQAIGYSCRIAKKTPEACIKENESHRPSSILMGWRIADTEIHAQQLDPNMGEQAMKTSLALQREAEARAAQPKKPAEKKPEKAKADGEKSDETTDAAADESGVISSKDAEGDPADSTEH